MHANAVRRRFDKQSVSFFGIVQVVQHVWSGTLHRNAQRIAMGILPYGIVEVCRNREIMLIVVVREPYRQAFFVSNVLSTICLCRTNNQILFVRLPFLSQANRNSPFA